VFDKDNLEGLVRHISARNECDSFSFNDWSDKDFDADSIFSCITPNVCNSNTDIHAKFGCNHYKKIRELLTNSRNANILSQDELRLFDLMEPYMRVGDTECSDAYDMSAMYINKNYNIYDKTNTMLSSNNILTNEEKIRYCNYFKINNDRKPEQPRLNNEQRKIEPQNTSLHKEKLGIITNIAANAEGMYGFFPGGIVLLPPQNFIQLNKPYQATIHELWHNMDALAGELGYLKDDITVDIFLPYTKIYIEDTPKGTTLKSALEEDFKILCEKGATTHRKDFWSCYKVNERIDFYSRFRNQLIENTIDGYRYKEPGSLFCPFDILEGLSIYLESTIGRDKVSYDKCFEAIAPREPKYWTGMDGQNVAMEYFAEIGSINAVGDIEARRIMNALFPNAYEVYRKIIKAAVNRAEQRKLKMWGSNDYKKFVKTEC
jgi:hypothetical protein